MSKTIKVLMLLALLAASFGQAQGSTLNIVTTSLPAATANVPYLAPIQATGGNPPYTWSAVSLTAKPALPAGLAIQQAKAQTGTADIGGTATVPGTYQFYLVVKDTASHSAKVLLTLTVSPQQVGHFSLLAMANGLTVQQGTQGHVSVTATTSGGFNSSITLSTAGLPSGATATFSPNPIPAPGAGNSTATISVSSSTTVGVYTVTVYGAAEGLRESTTFSLKVTAAPLPSFTLTALPSLVSVIQGNATNATATTAIVGGFNSAIALSAAGVPSGTTLTFNPRTIPAPGAGNSVILISVSAGTALGTYPIVITGNGGGVLQSVTLTLTVTAVPGAMPQPTPPQASVDTTWNPPVGNTLAAHTAAQFQSFLNSSLPGDTIVLDAGVTYSGNFTIPYKANPEGEWIYIETSALASLPEPGTRVGLADAVNMPIISTPNVSSVFMPAPGANHFRFVGVQVQSNSNQGANLSIQPPSNNFSWCLFCYSPVIGQQIPDSFIFDRTIWHGSDTQDVGQAIQLNVSNGAVVDSYIYDIHESTFDSQAILAYFTPGPLKIVNNFLEASTENVMLGGAGNYNNPWVPSDVVIDSNDFVKKASWDSCGVHGTVPAGFTLPNGQVCSGNEQWIVKTNLEIKSARRVQVTHNTMQNNWPSGQVGFAVDLTVRTSQSGNLAVVDDILLQDNVFTGTTSGVFIIGQDGQCSSQQGYPQCTTPGEEKRVKVANNVMELRHGQDSTRNQWLNLDGGNTFAGVTTIGSTDVIVEHNSAYMADNSEMGWGWYVFALPQLSWGCTPPPGFSSTHNVWILNNAVTSQPSGDCGFQGLTALQNYMSDPNPVAPRFVGNVLGVPSDEQVQHWTTCNEAVQGLQFNSQGQLTNFAYEQCTTDGLPAGYNPGQ